MGKVLRVMRMLQLFRLVKQLQLRAQLKKMYRGATDEQLLLLQYGAAQGESRVGQKMSGRPHRWHAAIQTIQGTAAGLRLHCCPAMSCFKENQLGACCQRNLTQYAML